MNGEFLIELATTICVVRLKDFKIDCNLQFYRKKSAWLRCANRQ